MHQFHVDGIPARQSQSEMDWFMDQFRVHLVGQKGRSANTVRIYVADLVSFRRFLERGGIDVRAVTRHDVRQYLAWLSTEGRSGRGGYARVSIARKLVVLKGFYRYLVWAGVVAITPIPKGGSLRVKVEKHLPVFMGKEETRRMLESPNPSTPEGLRDRAMLEVLYSCGPRLSEIAALNLKDLDTLAQEIRVWGKGSKERILLLGKPAVSALGEYLVSGRPLLQARNRRGTVYEEREALLLNRYGSRLSRRGIEKAVRKYALKAATRPGVHTHTLRHTFATHLMDGGADLRVVQELLGHASPTTTQIYTHVTQTQARQVYLATHPRASKGKEDA